MVNKVVDEADIEKLFISARKNNPRKVLRFSYFLLTTLIVASISFYLLNFDALNQKIAWWYNDQFGSRAENLTIAVTNYDQTKTTKSETQFPQIENNSIYIESISLRSPIIFGVENTESSVSSNLKKGLIQIKGTSLPGETGNTFITGHSSNYPWVGSQYNAIFALLGNVSIGDYIQLKYDNTNYIYRVTKKFVVSPNETAVMNSDDNSTILTLMTCTPVGTNIKRLIVQADQIIPDPTTNKRGQNSNQKIPEGIR